jgi:HlyD family secretion protein
MKKKKYLIIVVTLIVISAVLYLLLKEKNTKITAYEYSNIKKGTIESEITATGTLNASQTIEVGTQVSGIVSKIFADYNDVVEKGQIIAMIDTITLANQVADAENSLLKAKAQLQQQKKEYDRYKELFEKKVVTQSEYDQVCTDYITAQISLKSSETQLSRAKTNLDYATIKAPISGVVISRSVELGQTVAASFSTPTLFTIANDLEKMQLEAKIDEADIGKVKKDQEVTFTVDAYPDEKFTGVVKQIRLQPTTTENVVKYSVIIDVPNPDQKLLPGMSANISIKVEAHKDVLIVPLSALFFDPTAETTSTTATTTAADSENKLWVVCESNSTEGIVYNGVRMKQIAFKKGLDNGSFVEISGENIKEGLKIIIGTKEVATEETKSLLSPPKESERPPMIN